MKKRYLLILFATLLFPSMANAECSSSRMIELNEIASNVNLSYTYEIGTSGPIFDVKINNLTKDIYILSSVDEKVYYGSGEIIDDQKYVDGDSVTYTIYSNDNNCKGMGLTSKYLEFPSYNVYSVLEDCQKEPEFKYCAKWLNTTNLSPDEFDSELKKYQDSKANKQELKNDKKENNILNYRYYILIVGALIALGVVIFIVYSKRKKLQ